MKLFVIIFQVLLTFCFLFNNKLLAFTEIEQNEEIFLYLKATVYDITNGYNQKSKINLAGVSYCRSGAEFHEPEYTNEFGETLSIPIKQDDIHANKLKISVNKPGYVFIGNDRPTIPTTKSCSQNGNYITLYSENEYRSFSTTKTEPLEIDLYIVNKDSFELRSNNSLNGNIDVSASMSFIATCYSYFEITNFTSSLINEILIGNESSLLNFSYNYSIPYAENMQILCMQAELLYQYNDETKFVEKVNQIIELNNNTLYKFDEQILNLEIKIGHFNSNSNKFKYIKEKSYPIKLNAKFWNSSFDDFGIVYTKEGFFTSNKEGGIGSDDIYRFYDTSVSNISNDSLLPDLDDVVVMLPNDHFLIPKFIDTTMYKEFDNLYNAFNIYPNDYYGDGALCYNDNLKQSSLSKNEPIEKWIKIIKTEDVNKKLMNDLVKAIKKNDIEISKKENDIDVIFKCILQYQKENSLPIGNLDLQTLNKLGIQIEEY